MGHGGLQSGQTRNVAHAPTRWAHTTYTPCHYPLSRNYCPVLNHKEPGIRIGIPICSCPDYLTLMERRADNLSVPCTLPYFPASLRVLVRVNDTVPALATAFAGKRVLVLVGADSLLSPLLTIVTVTVVSFVPFFEDVDDDDDSKYSTAVNELLQWWTQNR